MDRAFLTALLCLGLIILAKRRFNWSNAIKENIWLMLLIAYILISCSWSDTPFLSFKRWTKEFVAVTMAFIVATEPEPRKALESLFRRTVYIAIPFSYILIHYFAEYGRMYIHREGLLMWTGVAVHKNSLGQLCIFSVFFLIWTFVRRQQVVDIPSVRYQTILEVFILLLALWILGGPQHTLTYSATATVSFALGVLTFTYLSWKKRRGIIPGQKVLIVLIAFTIIYGTVTPMLGRLSLINVSPILGREDTITGRTRVWAQLVPTAMSRPILGYGFGGFWTTTTREAFDISGAHNGYLDIILELGFVGLLLYAIFLLSSIGKAQRMMAQDFDRGSLWSCYLLMLVVCNITESMLNTFTFLLPAVILFLTVSSTRAENNPEISLQSSSFLI